MAVAIPSKKKVPYKIKKNLWVYLDAYKRKKSLPVEYEDLLHAQFSTPLINAKGEDTLWETLQYSELEREDINAGLTELYALLKTDGDLQVIEHLEVARVDYCTFGNTRPFRVRIINRLNDNYDHFYVKRADASRVYGLELEDILSPNSLSYFVDGNTLVEEHIAGVPGDEFMKYHLKDSEFNQIRLAKEFVKFNERCFVRLLGDMRAYNYVVDVTPDIEGSQFRLRPIDFDQQSYEGRKNFYLPQYFKENNPIIFLGMKHMSSQTLRQYQLEERSMIAARAKTFKDRFEDLMEVMTEDVISSAQKVRQLAIELGEHHSSSAFRSCKTMGEIVQTNIELVLDKEFVDYGG
ncbi:MAG: hypothetical protein AAGI49_10175 [Bacteroidota bacterium]